MRRRRALAVASAVTAASAIVAGLGCSADRTRIAPPRVSLRLDDSVGVPGGVITGMAGASDVSGLTSLVVTVRTDSVYAQRVTVIRSDTLELAFSLRISSTATVGSPIEVIATAFDDQLFAVSTRDTAVVVAP